MGRQSIHRRGEVERVIVLCGRANRMPCKAPVAWLTLQLSIRQRKPQGRRAGLTSAAPRRLRRTGVRIKESAKVKESKSENWKMVKKSPHRSSRESSGMGQKCEK